MTKCRVFTHVHWMTKQHRQIITPMCLRVRSRWQGLSRDSTQQRHLPYHSLITTRKVKISLSLAMQLHHPNDRLKIKPGLFCSSYGCYTTRRSACKTRLRNTERSFRDNQVIKQTHLPRNQNVLHGEKSCVSSMIRKLRDYQIKAEKNFSKSAWGLVC